MKLNLKNLAYDLFFLGASTGVGFDLSRTGMRFEENWYISQAITDCYRRYDYYLDNCVEGLNVNPSDILDPGCILFSPTAEEEREACISDIESDIENENE